MTRSVEAWIGKTDDSAIPPRVRLRIWEAAGGRCQICGRKLGPADRWDADHVVALVNGGTHSEANLQVACTWCHKAKTAEDVAQKAHNSRVRMRHAGIRKSSSLRSAPFPSAKPQRRATTPLEPAFPGDIRGVRSDFGPNIVFTDEQS